MLLQQVGRHWHTHIGDHERSSGLHYLAEIIFREIGAAIMLTDVRVCILKFVAEYGRIEIQRPDDDHDGSLIEYEPRSAYLESVLQELIRESRRAEDPNQKRLAEVQLSSLVDHVVQSAHRWNDHKLLRLLSRVLEDVTLSEPNLVRLWVHVEYGMPVQVLPSELLKFATRPGQQLRLLCKVDMGVQARHRGESQEMERAFISAKQDLENILGEETGAFVRLALQNQIYRAVGDTLAASTSERELVKQVVAFQREQLESALIRERGGTIPHGQPVDDPTEEVMVDLPYQSLSSLIWARAAQSSLLDAFYTAVRHGEMIMARELHDELLAMEPDMPSLESEPWIWHGMCGVMLSAETNSDAENAFNLFSSTFSTAKNAARSTRNKIAMSIASDHRFITVKMMCNLLDQQSDLLPSQQSTETAATHLKALMIAEEAKSHSLVDAFKNGYTSAKGGLDDLPLYGDIQALNNANRRRRAEQRIKASSEVENRGLLSAETPESEDGWDMLSDLASIALENVSSFEGVIPQIPENTLVLDYIYGAREIMMWAIDRRGDPKVSPASDLYGLPRRQGTSNKEGTQL